MTQSMLTRLVVCVDESDYAEDGTLGHGNTSNVFRLQSLAATSAGLVDNHGRAVNQTVRYHQAAKESSGGAFARLQQSRTAATDSVEQQVRYIVEDICGRISDEAAAALSAEVFLYGAGRGAHIVQAVASLLEVMGIPHSTASGDYDRIYQTALALIDARRRNDTLSADKLTTYLQSHCYAPPPIRFLGMFDALRTSVEKYEYQSSLSRSVQHLRHALAFNDTQTATTSSVCETPPSEDMGEARSFIQAWFMGTHQDMCGGSEHDGLSLFPLQWMLLESLKAGLVLKSDEQSESSTGASVMSLAFPQFAGSVPDLATDEKAHWRIKYTNGIEVAMFDLQSVQVESAKSASDHSIRFKPASGRSLKTQRKLFGDNMSLLGWVPERPYGNIIHPSMFVMLDRHAQYYDQGIFKARKGELLNFLECIDDQGKTQPWLEGITLKESEVSAFRILVCGKTGVGKSTLINKVFGVEMTAESTTYSQGVHDINMAFESPNHPGLLIHDSRGWQAGSDAEIDEIAKFLRYRAYQKTAEKLHVIWFCVNSDVSRIEEADRRTFEIISQFSSDVPVFVIGTKKDRLVAIRKSEVLETYFEKVGDFKEANRLANEEGNEYAEGQFQELRNQLSSLKYYKADGYSCVSKDDPEGIRKLIGNTLELIADERVRVFCVAAQVVDVEQKIDQAITEVMRLGAHAIRTAMVPLPASGLIGTPTVSRILCEHVMQCFGFPKTTPEAVEEIMSKVVMKNLKSFMRVSLTQFGSISAVAIGIAIPTGGIGIVAGIAGCILAAPPTARMLLKCACDMILILERSFRYQGKYISAKQIEDAATYYTTTMDKLEDGTHILLQQKIHDQIDKMIPLKGVGVGFKFGKLRAGLQEVIYNNRYDKEGANAAKRVDSSQIERPSLDKSSIRSPTTSPAPPAQAWRDWKGDHGGPAPSHPAASLPSPHDNYDVPAPAYTPTANYLAGSSTKHPHISTSQPMSFEIAELDSTPVTPHLAAAELEGVESRPAVVSELQGDYGFPQQIHPDYASPTQRAIPQLPSMRLAGTLYTPVDGVMNVNVPSAKPSTPDLASMKSNISELSSVTETSGTSTENLSLRSKKSSGNIFKGIFSRSKKS